MSLEWVRIARHGGMVQRTHTVPTIQQHYSVAEHTFNAIIIAREICKNVKYGLPMGKGVGMEMLTEQNIIFYILKHDLAEGYTGDTPGNVKKDLSMRNALAIVECRWEEENIPAEYKSDTLNSSEVWVAKLADNLELALFCLDEYSMGNRHPIFMIMLKRIEEYIQEHLDGYSIEVIKELYVVRSTLKELRGCL